MPAPGARSWEYDLEGFDGDPLVHAGVHVGVSVRPCLCGFQGIELGDDQTTGKSGIAGFRGIDRGMGAGNE